MSVASDHRWHWVSWSVHHFDKCHLIISSNRERERARELFYWFKTISHNQVVYNFILGTTWITTIVIVSAADRLANTWVNSIVVRLHLGRSRCRRCRRRHRRRLFVWNIAINKNEDDDDDDEVRVYVYTIIMYARHSSFWAWFCMSTIATKIFIRLNVTTHTYMPKCVCVE